MTLRLAWLLCCVGAALGRDGTNLRQPAPRNTPTPSAAIPDTPRSNPLATGTVPNTADILPDGATSHADPLEDFAALIPVPESDDDETDDPSISADSAQDLTDDDDEGESNFDTTSDSDSDGSPDDLLSVQLRKEDEALSTASQDDAGHIKDPEHFPFNGNDKINSNMTPPPTPQNSASSSSSSTSHFLERTEPTEPTNNLTSTPDLTLKTLKYTKKTYSRSNPSTKAPHKTTPTDNNNLKVVTDELKLNRGATTDTDWAFPNSHKKPDSKAIKGKTPHKTHSIGAEVTTTPLTVTPSKKTKRTPSTRPTTSPGITNRSKINPTHTNPLPLVSNEGSPGGRLWRGMRCEGLQYKDSPDCLVAVPSQPMYPWDVFRTTYEVIMAELRTRYTALNPNTPTLDGVKVFCKGMEELKLALRWCYLLLPNATRLMIMPQSTVSFYLDRGRYTFADQWNYDAVEVRCPATLPFWIRRFDPSRCDTDNAQCLALNMDLKPEFEKTTIP